MLLAQSTAASIFDYVFSMWGMIIVVALGQALCFVVIAIAKQWRKAREAELDATLKAEMIQQGRSVEEIERVLRATSRKAAAASDDE